MQNEENEENEENETNEEKDDTIVDEGDNFSSEIE
jgi:hypothetical protein